MNQNLETRYDVAVIGGHNGLTCACYLAKAGLKVIVFERRNCYKKVRFAKDKRK